MVLLAAPEDLKGDAAQNYGMLQACGCAVERAIPADARLATIVVDALLGTGISGPATGAMLDAIGEINRGFPLAKVIAVDIPSGMPSDTEAPVGTQARADYTVTFTAPKRAHALAPNCDALGELHVAAIGSPPSLYDEDVPSGCRWCSRRCSAICSSRARAPATKAASAMCWLSPDRTVRQARRLCAEWLRYAPERAW